MWTEEQMLHLEEAARRVGTLGHGSSLIEHFRESDEPVIAMAGVHPRYTLAEGVEVVEYWTTLEAAAQDLGVDLSLDSELHRPPVRHHEADVPNRATWKRPTWRDICRVEYRLDPADVRVLPSEDHPGEGWDRVFTFGRFCIVCEGLRPMPVADWSRIWASMSGHLKKAQAASPLPRRLIPLTKALRIATSCGALDLTAHLCRERDSCLENSRAETKRVQATASRLRQEAHSVLSSLIAGEGSQDTLERALDNATRLSAGERKIVESMSVADAFLETSQKPGPTATVLDVVSALQASGGNVSAAARQAGLSREHFHARMRQDGIEVVTVAVESWVADAIRRRPEEATTALRAIQSGIK